MIHKFKDLNETANRMNDFMDDKLEKPDRYMDNWD